MAQEQLNREGFSQDSESLSHDVLLKVGMESNGYFLSPTGEWTFDSDTVHTVVEDRYRNQRVSFFGPAPSDLFFAGDDFGYDKFVQAFSQPKVQDATQKFLPYPSVSQGVSFLFGGLVREIAGLWPMSNEALDAVSFTAQKTLLADRKSAEAVASTIALYILSDGSLAKNRSFDGDMYYMAEAVSEDPISVRQTPDLGLSQVARLRSFLEKKSGVKSEFPDVTQELADFADLPTVGAEFHLPPSIGETSPNFWQRLAIVNLSQFQPDSAIQLAKNDHGVIEIRMNPSVYPVTIANWNHLRLVLPELNRAYFHITVNKQNQDNFDWSNSDDEVMLKKLISLGLLSYAGLYQKAPGRVKSQQVDFGGSYLGQTIKYDAGEASFTGLWGARNKGVNGQISIYTGFGENLAHLSYYLSMLLANPKILTPQISYRLPFIKSLSQAYSVSDGFRENVFASINRNIQADKTLSHLTQQGNRIMEKLNP